MSLLGMPDGCTLDPTLAQDAAAPYLIVEWLRQLSLKCCQLWTHMFKQLDGFLNGTRAKRDEFRGSKARLARCLGRVYQALIHLETNMHTWPPPVSFKFFADVS